MTDGSAGGTDALADLSTFTSKTKLFTIDVPKDWKNDVDESSDKLVNYVWFGPAKDSAIFVNLAEVSEKQNATQLGDAGKQFLTSAFGSEKGFTQGEPKTQTDGSVLITWSATPEKLNDGKTELAGSTFIEQRGDKLSILTIFVPSEQFDASKDALTKIVNSYMIDDTAKLKE